MTAKRNSRNGTKALPEQEGALGGDAAAGVPPGAPGLAGASGDTPGQASSMAESVTRHALNPLSGNFQFLLCGIDTLDLGLYVSWDEFWKRTKTHLDTMKESATGTDGILGTTATEREFLYLPNGKPPNYRYHLHFPEYHLFLAISDKPGNSPNVYVSLTAEALWHVGLSILLEMLASDLGHFGGVIMRIQPSRCDLCADFALSSPLSYPLLDSHKVSLSRKNRVITNGGTLETYYCGSPDSPVQMRIYDKGKEIVQNNKHWFLPIWGIEAPSNVWRVEYQLRRPFLHQYRVHTLDDLWQKIGDIWDYLTADWFSLRLPDNEKSERRSITPWWQAVHSCGERFGLFCGAQRTFSSDSMEPIQRTLSHIISHMISIAAHKGISDRKEAILQLGKLIYMGTTDEKFSSEYRKRAIKLGYRGDNGGSDDE